MNYKSISHEQKLATENWWRAFQRDQAQIAQSFNRDSNSAFNSVQWMADNLSPIADEIMWEFGPGISKEHRLVLTPETRAELRPLIRYILSQAPDLPGWEFYEYRLKEDFAQLTRSMEGRCGWGDISQVEFRITPGADNTIDITFYLNEEDFFNYGEQELFVLLEYALGEENLDKWFGVMDVEKQNVAKDTANVTALSSFFEAQKQELLAALPADQLFALREDCDWVAYKLDPEKRHDYPEKQDMFVAPYIAGDIFMATLSNYFYSERFSRFGETFVYLKIDGSADDVRDELFEDKSDIEEALNKALSEKCLGCHIGGGTGYKYSYVDLAITDLEKAIPVIQSVLQQGKLTKRSWLLFHDQDMKAEWIGVWDDTPPPPGGYQ